MTEKQKLYKEHQDEMFGITSVDELTEEDVDRIIARLLSCLPNNGKLYKYRSIKGQAFENALKGLKNGYLWMTRADKFNDDTDNAMIYDPVKDIKELFERIKQNPDKFVKNITKDKKTQIKIINAVKDGLGDKLVKCYDRDKQQYNKAKVIKLITEYTQDVKKAVEYANQILIVIDPKLEEGLEKATDFAASFVSLNQLNRESSYCYCFSDGYDYKNMWAYYANVNCGFCIEYDIKKVQYLPFDIKKRIIYLFKVVYRKKLSKMSFVDFMEYIFTGQNDDNCFIETNRKLMNRTVTKDKDWENEHEWRIVSSEIKDNKINADMVSGIIIDERVVGTYNAKRLMKLAKKRGWSVKIRSKDVIGTKHVYKEISL